MFVDHTVSRLTLNNNALHVWVIEPAKVRDGKLLDSLKGLLSNTEIEKVQRYRLAKAKHTALITRAFVRLVLSQYTNVPAQKWSFNIGAHGKPEINRPPIPLSFNLSHNDDLIICAVSMDKKIGCDIENLSRKISIKAIAQRYFSTTEFDALMALPPPLQRRRFFEYWTLKEAFVKATGMGISQGLESFNFTIGKAKAGQFNHNIQLNFSPSCTEQDNQRWHSCLLYPDQTHCIALCVKTNNVVKPLPDKAILKVQLFDGLDLLCRY